MVVASLWVMRHLMHWWQKWSIEVFCLCVFATESFSSLCSPLCLSMRLSVCLKCYSDTKPSTVLSSEMDGLGRRLYKLHSCLQQQPYHCCVWGMWNEHFRGRVVVVMGGGLIWQGMTPHYQSLPLWNEICLFGSVSSKGIELLGQYGQVLWQTCGCVIIISLTTPCQRDVISESI